MRQTSGEVSALMAAFKQLIACSTMLRISREWTGKGLYSISSSNYSILSTNVRLWPVLINAFLHALLVMLVLFWVVLFLVNFQRLLTHSKLTDLIPSFNKMNQANGCFDLPCKIDVFLQSSWQNTMLCLLYSCLVIRSRFHIKLHCYSNSFSRISHP